MEVYDKFPLGRPLKQEIIGLRYGEKEKKKLNIPKRGNNNTEETNRELKKKGQENLEEKRKETSKDQKVKEVISKNIHKSVIDNITRPKKKKKLVILKLPFKNYLNKQIIFKQIFIYLHEKYLFKFLCLNLKLKQ